MTKLSAVAESDLRGIRDIDIDDVLAYVHSDLKRLPDYTELYKRYLRQRWDVYELDFTQDAADWRERMTQQERDAFVGISAGLPARCGSAGVFLEVLGRVRRVAPFRALPYGMGLSAPRTAGETLAGGPRTSERCRAGEESNPVRLEGAARGGRAGDG